MGLSAKRRSDLLAIFLYTVFLSYPIYFNYWCLVCTLALIYIEEEVFGREINGIICRWYKVLA